MGSLLIIIAATAFARLCRMAWDGQLGLVAIDFLVAAAICFSVGRKRIDESTQELS